MDLATAWEISVLNPLSAPLFYLLPRFIPNSLSSPLSHSTLFLPPLSPLTHPHQPSTPHPFLPPSPTPLFSSQHAAADFFHPVISIYPDMEVAYTAVVKSPMDLSTLSNYLQDNSLMDEEDFYVKVRGRWEGCVVLKWGEVEWSREDRSEI